MKTNKSVYAAVVEFLREHKGATFPEVVVGLRPQFKKAQPTKFKRTIYWRLYGLKTDGAVKKTKDKRYFLLGKTA